MSLICKAQYQSQEYALLINKEGYTGFEVKRALHAKYNNYNLLLTAASFKVNFDTYAE
jgi:hypothetical protein